MHNPIYGAPIAVLWLSWVVYWFIASRDVKTTRRSETIMAGLAHKVPLLIGAALLAVPEPPLRWLSERFLPQTLAVYLIGILLLAAGLAGTVWARIHLGRNWSATVTLKQGHEFIRTGPYRFVRHPIYSGLLLAFLGTAIAVGEWRGLLAVAFVVIAFTIKLRAEEDILAEDFRDDYERYRADVPALIPSLSRHR